MSSPYGSWILRRDALISAKSRLASATPASPTTSSAPWLLQCTSGRPEIGLVAMRPASGKKAFSKEGKPASKVATTAPTPVAAILG
ncbi:hypothetical protein U9M48_020285 [Paspalum notatum var. saurae]|uniref:Uncharacterized protein n=1 Tax=Paspalum notatum var. saurae TaxID=547442 RepID=A0AAQ3TH89_PASNO